MEIRLIRGEDREAVAALLERIPTFSRDEVACALELVDCACQVPAHPDYKALVALRDGRLAGYVCYGPTPMTQGTFDLYWIASDPDMRGQGVGAALVGAMEEDLRSRQGRRIRVETSATEDYGPTRGFYRSLKYEEEARFRDFYKDGDDLVILAKRL